jgi:ribosome-associated translation inhibitor RaiA
MPLLTPAQWAYLFFWFIVMAPAESSTTFVIGKYAQSPTGHYANNLKLNKILRIPDADELEITIRGKIEKCCQSKTITKKCCDYLTIYDSNEQEIGKFSGLINEHLYVTGSTIRVTFRSDRRTTDEGIKVTIATRLPASIFNEIKGHFLAVIEQFLTFGTTEAYIKIRYNLQSIKTLHTTLIQREEIASIVNEIAEELLAIGRSYQEIAAMAPAIMAKHQEQFKIINEFKSKTFYNIEKIEQQQKKYQELLEKTQQEVSSSHLNNSLEEQKTQFSIDSYNNILQTLYAQQAIWNKFYEAQEILEQKLKKYSEKIGILLYILNINAQVYEQAANVALLHNTTIVSLNNLSHLTELQKIMAEIEGSENEITQWLSKIEQTQL